MRTRLALVVAAALAATSLTACGPRTPLSLRMRTVSITTPRLLTPAIELVPPAVVPVSLPPVPAFEPAIVAPPAVVIPPRPPACPKAGPFAVPAISAAQSVAGPPAPGTSFQTSEGAFATANGRGSLVGGVVTVVTPLPTATTTAGQKVEAWRVLHADPERKTVSIEVYQLVHPSTSPLATSPGIYLVAMAWDDPVRGALRFQPPGDGLWILPSPVQLSASTGVQYAGAATDPASLTTLALTRNVTGRKRVDACGVLIDTFTVEMSGVLTTAGSQRQVAWTQQLATAHGGAIVEETLALSSPVDGFVWARTLRNTTVPKEVS